MRKHLKRFARNVLVFDVTKEGERTVSLEPINSRGRIIQ